MADTYYWNGPTDQYTSTASYLKNCARMSQGGANATPMPKRYPADVYGFAGQYFGSRPSAQNWSNSWYVGPSTFPTAVPGSNVCGASFGM